MDKLADNISKTLKKIRGKRVSEVIKGLPDPPTNSDETDQGTYGSEGLVDPGIVNGVTGSGRGPEMHGR